MSTMTMKCQRAFSGFTLRTGCLYDYTENEHPSVLYSWLGGEALDLLSEARGDTFFGYVHSGPTWLQAEHNHYRLQTGQYFCTSENVHIFRRMRHCNPEARILRSKHCRWPYRSMRSASLHRWLYRQSVNSTG
jgi:hypothetical protein